MNFETLLKQCPLIAILRGIRPEEVETVCDVLYESGILLLEIPLNSPDALRSIEIAARHVKSRQLAGAGTVLTPEEAAQPGSATPAAPAPVVEAPAAPAASAVETSAAPAPAAPAAPAVPAAPAPEAAPVAETPAPAPVPEQPIVYAYDSVVPAPKAETPPAAPAAPAASETAAVPQPEPTNAVTSVATIPADTPETETTSKMESSATATPAYPASLSSPTRRTLLGNRASDERIGPAKIPAARLRSQSEQAQPGVYSGTLASSPLFGSHPTKFRLVTKNRDNRETTVAYVYGNSGQLTSFLGETLTISGAIYWFRDTELPTVFAQDILRGKSGSAAAR